MVREARGEMEELRLGVREMKEWENGPGMDGVDTALVFPYFY